jgi:hypothetical protein
MVMSRRLDSDKIFQLEFLVVLLYLLNLASILQLRLSELLLEKVL